MGGEIPNMVNAIDLAEMVTNDVRNLIIDRDFPRVIARTRGDFREAWTRADAETKNLKNFTDILIDLVGVMSSCGTPDIAYVQNVANELRKAFFYGHILTDRGRGKVSEIAQGLLAVFVRSGELTSADPTRKPLDLQIAGILFRHTPRDIVRAAVARIETKAKVAK